MTYQPETFVVEHGQYLKDYPGQARILSLTRMLPRHAYSSTPHRTGAVREMRSQIARDAFERGLGIIGLAEPFYRVEQYLALRQTPLDPGSYQNPEWTHEEPEAHLLDQRATVEILIEAVGFPIRIQEV
jgi:hypothetical protein